MPASESEMDQQLGYTAVRIKPARSRPAKSKSGSVTHRSIFPSATITLLGQYGLLKSQQHQCVLSERPFQERRGEKGEDFRINRISTRPWLVPAKRRSQCCESLAPEFLQGAIRKEQLGAQFPLMIKSLKKKKKSQHCKTNEELVGKAGTR